MADLAEVRRWRCQVEQAEERVKAAKYDLQLAESALERARCEHRRAMKEANRG